MANKEVNEIKEGERVKPIIIRDKETGDEFTLEFSLESVKFAEQRGFKFEDVGNYPATKVEELFYYAFRMHHRNVPREKTNRILWEKIGGLNNLPDGFVERLGQLYYAPMSALGGDEKNARVTVEL